VMGRGRYVNELGTVEEVDLGFRLSVMIKYTWAAGWGFSEDLVNGPS
jgi:hypothetical protein